MTWLTWLIIALLVATFAALTGIKPKDSRQVAHTRLMGVARAVLVVAFLIVAAYLALRTAAKGEWVPYELFGRTFEPASPATWAIPIVLLAIGGGLLQPARRITARAWLAATQEVPGEPPAPVAAVAPAASSPAAAAGQGASS